MHPLKSRTSILFLTRLKWKGLLILYYHLSSFQIRNRDFKVIKFGFIKTFSLCLLWFVSLGFVFLCVLNCP